MKKESFARRAILAAFSTTVVLALAPMSGAWAADAAKDLDDPRVMESAWR